MTEKKLKTAKISFCHPLFKGYSHPFHLHGTHFRLMKVGYGEYHANNGSIWRMNRDIPCIDDKVKPMAGAILGFRFGGRVSVSKGLAKKFSRGASKSRPGLPEKNLRILALFL